MMLALADAPGEFRKGGVGVFADGKAIHIAPSAERVPALINNLFDWLNSTLLNWYYAKQGGTGVRASRR